MLSRLLALSSSCAIVFAVACSSSTTSSSSGGSCNTNPFACPSGQTCWPSDTSGTFACLPSQAAGTKGSTCQDYPGTPTCGDGMFCLQETTAGGTCVTYCDSSHACASGEQCIVAQLGNTSQQVHVCYSGSLAGDAGAQDGGGTTSDAASEAGADAAVDAASDAGADATGD